MKLLFRRLRIIALITLGVAALTAPADAWYYFTSTTGNRIAWRASYRPVTIVVGTDYETAANDLGYSILNTVLNEWDKPYVTSVNLLKSPPSTLTPSNTTMNLSTVNGFLRSPQAGKIWIVLDATGAIFSGLGLDPSSGILGLGLPFMMATNPSEIGAGMVLINYWYMKTKYSSDKDLLYTMTLLHELGHVLGFAHSVSGKNTLATVAATTPAVMYPFATLGPPASPTTLQHDDKAAVITVYGL